MSMVGGCLGQVLQDYILQYCTPSSLCAQGFSFGRHLELPEHIEWEKYGEGTLLVPRGARLGLCPVWV